MGTPGKQRIKNYGIEFKLKAVQLSDQPGVLVTALRSHGARVIGSLTNGARSTAAWGHRSCAGCVRMKEITQTRVHYGYRRVHVMLKREGFKDNHKRVYHLYKEQGLSLRHKRPKRNKAAQLRQPKTVAHQINQIWSMAQAAHAHRGGLLLA